MLRVWNAKNFYCKKQKENVRVPEPAGQRSPWRNTGLAGNTALEGTPRLRPHGTPSCSVSGWAAWCKRCARRPGWRCTRNAPATQTDRRCSLSLYFRFVHGEKLKALQLLHQIILYHSYQSPASKKDGSVCRNVALFSNSTLSCMYSRLSVTWTALPGALHAFKQNTGGAVTGLPP